MTEHDGVDKPQYVMAEVEALAERGRLEKLEGLHDAASLRRIDSIGIEAGAGVSRLEQALVRSPSN